MAVRSDWLIMPKLNECYGAIVTVSFYYPSSSTISTKVRSRIDFDRSSPLPTLSTLRLALIKDLQSLFGSLDTAESHSTEGRTHTVGTIDLGKLHTSNDESGSDLTGTLDNGVFGNVHIETAHATEGWDSVHAHHALDGEGTEWAVVLRESQNCAELLMQINLRQWSR